MRSVKLDGIKTSFYSTPGGRGEGSNKSLNLYIGQLFLKRLQIISS